jgi:hypothetical protein
MKHKLNGVPVAYLEDLRTYAGQVRGVTVSDEDLRALIGGIDPESCEVTWSYEQVLDPYGVRGVDPESECYNVGREYFARAAGSDVWISFVGLPDCVRDAIWDKHRKEIAFPAGLFDVRADDGVLPF